LGADKSQIRKDQESKVDSYLLVGEQYGEILKKNYQIHATSIKEVLSLIPLLANSNLPKRPRGLAATSAHLQLGPWLVDQSAAGQQRLAG
jgi:hypothetical protein